MNAKAKGDEVMELYISVSHYITYQTHTYTDRLSLKFFTYADALPTGRRRWRGYPRDLKDHSWLDNGQMEPVIFRVKTDATIEEVVTKYRATVKDTGGDGPDEGLKDLQEATEWIKEHIPNASISRVALKEVWKIVSQWLEDDLRPMAEDISELASELDKYQSILLDDRSYVCDLLSALARNVSKIEDTKGSVLATAAKFRLDIAEPLFISVHDMACGRIPKFEECVRGLHDQIYNELNEILTKVLRSAFEQVLDAAEEDDFDYFLT